FSLLNELNYTKAINFIHSFKDLNKKDYDYVVNDHNQDSKRQMTSQNALGIIYYALTASDTTTLNLEIITQAFDSGVPEFAKIHKSHVLETIALAKLSLEKNKNSLKPDKYYPQLILVCGNLRNYKFNNLN